MILGINTATSQTALAFMDKGKILGEISWKSKSNEAEKLLPALEKLLKKCRRKYSDIKKILVIKGPGSFTGLRIGVSVANIFAYLTKAKLYGLDTINFFWQSSLKKLPDAAVLLYAGSAGVYLSLLKDTSDFTGKARNINIADLAATLQKYHLKHVFGDITPDQKKHLKNVKFHKFPETFGEIIACLNFAKLSPVKIIRPIYIKNPGITLIKKNLIS